ncbi:uncharacterized protein LOC112885370 [Panicum hallii]|uniref:uncharacterized protein LOC112885370 n=1 Tax=Panicum hallii TaxID=206008 RepID=UPI000DF4E92C|nr:uncharacterized protein LOC112885370 [Panicum hallii]
MAGEDSHKNLEKNKGKEDEMHKEDDNAKFDVSKGSKKSGDHKKNSKSKSKKIVIESSSSPISSIEQPDSDDESFGPTMQQLFHHNAQAATILLSSLSREEFDKVDGLQSAKEIWDTLKVAHEGTKTIRKARIEMIEGELGRFAMLDDETPQEMYTRLKKMINQVRSLGSKKWTDHEVVKRMIRAFSVRNITLCTLIRESPNYKKMTPKEVLGKIINHQMMESEAKYVKSLSKGTSTSRGQDIALKANKKEKSQKVVQESSSSDNDKKRKDNKEKKYFTKDKKFFKKKQSGEAHLGKEWGSDDESSNSDEEEVATLAFNKTSLFPNLKDGTNITHTCLMARGGKRKVKTIPCSSPKYTTSDDESTSSSSSENDNDIDMIAMLKNLDKNAIAKFNELMEELNEKNDFLEKQEDLLILEKKKNLELKELITKQEEKCKALDKELAESKETKTSLKSANVALQDELVCLNKSLELQFDTLLSNASTSQHDPSINPSIA